MPEKIIKALTMVRNDRFLSKWVEYYGRELGYENLYVFFDGEDQDIPSFCNGVNARKIPKMKGTVVVTDRKRSRFMAKCAKELLADGADMVIATDADEFLVIDPNLGIGLKKFLSSLPDRPCHSGLGVDVMQHIPDEKPVDFNLPLLSQRSRGWLYSRYTKPSVITGPYVWGGGFHRVKGKNFHIEKGLYLFHFGGIDQEILKEISSDMTRINSGWRHHQLKRQRAMKKISKVKARKWEPTVRLVRLMQTVCRPIFALNKPTTFGMKFVVEIPNRFKNIL